MHDSAASALPHRTAGSDTRNCSIDKSLARFIVNRTAINTGYLRALFHSNGTALHPNSTGRTVKTGLRTLNSRTLCPGRQVLIIHNYTTGLHNQFTIGEANCRHTAKVFQNGAIFKRNGTYTIVGSNHSILSDIAMIYRHITEYRFANMSRRVLCLNVIVALMLAIVIQDNVSQYQRSTARTIGAVHFD